MGTTWTAALAGNPNTGKSSLFNALTGARQRVGNWPGVTVERKEGRVALGKQDVQLVDLPGIYSLGATSVDEQIAADFLRVERPRITILVADASNLERSLYLALQLRELGHPLLMALNMADLAKSKGMRIDTAKLEKLLGVTVVSTVASRGEGVDVLKQQLASYGEKTPQREALAIPYGEKVLESLQRLATSMKMNNLVPEGLSPHQAALRLAEGDASLVAMLEKDSLWADLQAALAKENAAVEAELGFDLQTAVIERRWAFLSKIAAEVVVWDPQMKDKLTLSDRIDQVATSRLLGLPIFLAISWAIFHLVYLWGDPVAEIFEGWVGTLGEQAAAFLEGSASPILTSFVVDGIIGGVGAVVVFLPHIFLLFAFLAVLEDSGYMARGVFVMDRILRAIGLHGKSFIPMLLGFGCNVPSIMATRIMERPRDRMITLLVLPFMSCSARMPVYILFAGTFFAEKAGTVIFSLYLLGIVVAIISAKVLGSTLFKGEASMLVMELPAYHLPRVGSVLRSAWERASLFLYKAGTFIMGSVVLIWVLASLPFGVEYGSEQSLVGQLGHLLAPLLAPFGAGFWQAGVALFFGFLAKEVVVGTFGTLFGVGEEGIAAVLPAYFTPLSAYAFLVMTLLYVPCVTVVAAFKRETNSWRWTAFMVFFTTLVAYVAAVAVYQGGRLLGLS